ncbi:MAG TPA: fused MFS/spermidine synthase [Gammaproteobacteria bacterium]
MSADRSSRSSTPGDAPLRRLLGALFALTGFSALCLQVVWQRVISIHGGVDLFSTATVVAAFMAGLGLGNLAGGTLADRLGARRSILAFAFANLGIGLFGWASVAIFYDGYRALAPALQSLPAAFAFHFALLVVPTTLMGLSLPLLSRGVVRNVAEAASVVGRLYAVNTLGAAVGAAVAGWLLLGNLGFDGTVRLASSLNLLAAIAVLALWRAAPPEPAPAMAPEASPRGAAFASGPVSAWLALYAVTGAAALALEVVYFRLVDGIMRSNSYTFAHVLTLYLLLFGAGAAAAGERARRSAQPDAAFLWIQFWIGAASLIGVLALLNAPPVFGLPQALEQYFKGEGFIYGFENVNDLRSTMAAVFAHLLAPALVMGAPVFLMGYAYPFIAALVLRRESTLGRYTGALMACNIVGNVAGSLIAGFVLLDLLGTAGTLALLAAVLMALGVAAALRQPRARVPRAAAALGTAAALLVLFPSNERLWSFLHGASPERFALVEERSCVNALVDDGGVEMLHLNAAAQNGYPYDDFHVLIGLFPALLHPNPQRALAVGLGIGATPYGMLLDPRLRSVETVEICAGLGQLLTTLGDLGAHESRLLLEDPRLDLRAGDGRKRLLAAEQPYDLVTVDALRPQSGYSGNVYSVEFYELVASRLAPRGLFAQWVPTPRVLASVTQVFPYVATAVGPGPATFLVASNEPLPTDLAGALERFRARPHGQLSPEQSASLARFLEHAQLTHVRRGEPRAAKPETELNRDLHPRDEYFLNDG